jgi:hypothetical protein
MKKARHLRRGIARKERTVRASPKKKRQGSRLRSPPSMSTYEALFAECSNAVAAGVKIKKTGGAKDKEFFFQEWFEDRLAALKILYDPPARNSYPDFRLVKTTEGYELKGLAFPGRLKDFDSNSQVPCGEHNGRQVFYVFGRYPSDGGTSFPLLDLIICHGDFLNVTRGYAHKNKNVKAFGSYGDIMIRDRKMYVVPSPFALTDGTTRQQTLILPEGYPVTKQLRAVGTLVRTECHQLVSGYRFNLQTNELTPTYIPNLHAGAKHSFTAYRLANAPGPAVTLVAEDDAPDQDVDDEDE